MIIDTLLCKTCEGFVIDITLWPIDLK